MKRKEWSGSIFIPLIIISISVFFPGCLEEKEDEENNSSYFFHFSGQEDSFVLVPVVLKSNGNSLFTKDHFEDGSWDNIQICVIDGHIMWNVSEYAHLSYDGDLQIDDPEGLDMSWEVSSYGQNLGVKIYYSGAVDGRFDFRFDYESGKSHYGFYFYNDFLYPGWNVYSISDLGPI